MVTQETYLFHASVRRNLMYAKPDATQEELEAVPESDEIGEEPAQDEQPRAEKHERGSPAAFSFV